MSRQRRRSVWRYEIGQHDDEGVAARAVLGSEIDRSHLELDGFRVAKRPFDPGEVLVALVHDLFGDEGLWQIGAQSVATVEARRLGQRGFVDGHDHATVLDGDVNELVDVERLGASLQLGELRFAAALGCSFKYVLATSAAVCSVFSLSCREAANSAARAGLRRST